MNSIATAYEIIRFGPVMASYPPTDLQPHIRRVEETSFNNSFLGLTFYESLIADLSDYSSAVPFDAGGSYSTGDLVYYNNVVWRSLVDANTLSPDADDQLNPKWEFPDKFQSEQNNVLWERYLRYWVALNVLYKSIRYNTYKASARGIMVTKEDNSGMATISDRAFSAYKKELYQDAFDQLELMMTWMIKVTSDGTYDFSNIQEIQDNCTSSTAVTIDNIKRRRRKRFHFRN